MLKMLKFIKEGSGRWYVELPDYPGPRGDLQMVAGADTMLDIIAQAGNACLLTVSDVHFNGAEVLKLLTGYHEEHGDYILENYKGRRIDHKMWLCPVVTYVFGTLPEFIYFRE